MNIFLDNFFGFNFNLYSTICVKFNFTSKLKNIYRKKFKSHTVCKEVIVLKIKK